MKIEIKAKDVAEVYSIAKKKYPKYEIANRGNIKLKDEGYPFQLNMKLKSQYKNSGLKSTVRKVIIAKDRNDAKRKGSKQYPKYTHALNTPNIMSDIKMTFVVNLTQK